MTDQKVIIVCYHLARILPICPTNADEQVAFQRTALESYKCLCLNFDTRGATSALIRIYGQVLRTVSVPDLEPQ